MKAFIFFLLLMLPGIVHATIFDMGDASGLSKESTGNFYQLNAAGTATATKSGTNLSLVEKVNVPTSKGTFAFDLARSVPVDINRVGKAVRVLAVATGPVGLAVSTVDAICTLTSICNQAGQWLIPGSSQPGDTIDPSTGGAWYSTNNQAFSSAGAAGQYQCSINGGGGGATLTRILRTSLTAYFDTECYFPNMSPPRTMVSAYIRNFAGVPATQSHTPTSSDWDIAETNLNDQQFIQPLLDKNAPVPVGAPTISTPLKVSIGSETKTTKDGAGNTTGTETTTTEAEITQPSGAENPTNSPTVIKITENNTTNYYNTSNQLTSSVTTVTSSATPVPQQQEPITITIDNVPDVPLQSVAVPGTFSFSTWGSGSCPAPKTWVTMFGTHEFTYQLTCDFANLVKPIILLIAAIVSFMIVASIRTD